VGQASVDELDDLAVQKTVGAGAEADKVDEAGAEGVKLKTAHVGEEGGVGLWSWGSDRMEGRAPEEL
jgi:hypothetical protein